MSDKLKKILVGIRSNLRLFRVYGIGGAVVDALLDLRGTKGIDEDYWEQIGTSRDKDAYEVLNEAKGNSCKITLESIIITKRSVKDEPIDVKRFQKEADVIYGVVREILAIRELNRIGIVYEFETKVDGINNVNKFLYDNFLNYTHEGIPSNFTLRAAFKLASKNGILKPDSRDYYNVISQFGVKYDDERNPIEDKLFISVDVQRYFHPPVKLKNGNLVMDHFKYSEREIEKFIEKMNEKGIKLG